ncbi:amidase family protein [Nostoc sp.]|uniref:amidase family protein n=1 Tax=Nostoc sp. TaxID=1180 RepID=UPI002FF47371
MKLKTLKFLMLTAISAIALSISTHAYSQTATPTQGFVATVAEVRSYPTKFPVAEPNYTSKRARDFSPFTKALANFSPGRRKALDKQLLEATVPKMQQLMASGDLTATELVVYYLDRIRCYDINKLNSVMELNPDALAIAQKLDAERKAGKVRGGMHGIPVLLKDNIATGDKMHTTAGAYALKDWRADRDALLVQQLRKAGAVILGKANLSEWANYLDPSLPSGFSALGGQTRNPYGAFDPLGSSSGSAVSVAANLTAVSVGSETQGSVVQPSRINDVVGLKTSYGLVSGDYIIPLVAWADVPGPIGRTVTDVATLLTALVGTPVDAKPDFTKFLSLEAARKRRVGVATYGKAFVEEKIKQAIESDRAPGSKQPTENELAEARQILNQRYDAQNRQFQAAIATLRKQKIEVVEIVATKLPKEDLPNPVLEYSFKNDLNRFLAQAKGIPVKSLAKIIEINKADPTNRIPYGQRYIEASQNTAITAEEGAATKATLKTTATNALNQLFETNNISVLIVPTNEVFAHAPSGFPALDIPSGFSPEGEPQGIKLVGRYFGESDIIAVGYAYEQATLARKSPNLNATIATFKNLNQAVPRKY